MTLRPSAWFSLVRRGALAAGLALPVVLAAAEPPAPAAILEDLKSFATMGTVLHIAAHPDDENTNFITAMAKGRHYRSGYLSVTRGDGGQNEIGPEFDAELGVARTQELLAARRIDGGRQFFTRAMDFGYSKTIEETLRIWERDSVLGDVVRVIRTFRPDVIVNNFAAIQQQNQHGNHNASAVLGLEAFKLAADPAAYPEQLADGLTVWQAKRIMQGPGPTDVTGTDPVTGSTFAQLSQQSRAMHKTQGFGNVNAGRGGGGAPGAGGRAGGGAPGGPVGPGGAPAAGGPGGAGRAGGGPGGGGGRGGAATFNVLAGDPATTDLMEGVDTTWNRVAGGAEIGRLANEAIANFKPEDPSSTIPALLAIKPLIAGLLPSDPILTEKRQQLDQLIADCLGLTIETTLPQAEVVPGETLRLTNTVLKRSGFAARWTGVRYPASFGSATSPSAIALNAGQAATQEVSVVLPATVRVTQPYWLREPARPGLFVVPDVDRKLIGQPENPPAFPVEMLFEVGGQTIVLATEPYQNGTATSGPARRRHLDVIPPVIVHFPTLTRVFAPGSTQPVQVELTANRANTNGAVQLDLPAGWSATPATQDFRIAESGGKATVTFNVKAPALTGSATLAAHATVGGQRYATDRVAIDYPHIPYQLLQPAATIKGVSVNLAIKGSRVAYLPGAGDDVADCIAQMGYKVTEITGADLNANRLRDFDTVVIGVRAFNERPDLAPNLPALFAWVEGGGTVIAQYNRPNGLITPQLGPYDLSIQGQAPALRVTDENAPVTFLATDHLALTSPNRIAQDDFLNWVQERGTYFPSTWDQDHYKSILAMSDPGEKQPDSSLLVAQYGKGYYVYSGVAFFRQLPKGVPGAYRLFANLISLGK
jgi:LmbE family N-acetylglucosaminyl deacetylase